MQDVRFALAARRDVRQFVRRSRHDLSEPQLIRRLSKLLQELTLRFTEHFAPCKSNARHVIVAVGETDISKSMLLEQTLSPLLAVWVNHQIKLTVHHPGAIIGVVDA